MDGFAKTASSPTWSRISCNGLTFQILQWGPENGRPILLLHGFPQEPATWARVAEELANLGYLAVAPVQRGYSETNRPRERRGYAYNLFTLDAIGIANAMGFATFDLAGFGVGAAQSWMLAARYPSRVRSLAAYRYPHPAAFAETLQHNAEQKERWSRVQQVLGGSDPESKAAVLLANDAQGLRTFLATSGLPEPFLGRYILRLQEPGALVGALRWNQAISLEEFAAVPTITVPTLYVWSEGPGLTRAAADATKRYVSGRFTETSASEVGHFVLETAPEVVTQSLLQHLGST